MDMIGGTGDWTFLLAASMLFLSIGTVVAALRSGGGSTGPLNCIQCSATNVPEAKFCRSCGKDLTAAKTSHGAPGRWMSIVALGFTAATLTWVIFKPLWWGDPWLHLYDFMLLQVPLVLALWRCGASSATAAGRRVQVALFLMGLTLVCGVRVG